MASLRFVLILLVLAGCAAPAAADPGFLDLWHTVQAPKRLQDDPWLAPLNVGIRVRGRIAVLWGPVPSAEAARRAEMRLRSMIELIDVRNELIVMPEEPHDVAPSEAPPQREPPRNEPRLRLSESVRAAFATPPAAIAP